jgi:hypothetical protein
VIILTVGVERMIRIDGKDFPTIAEAASIFKVSEKTVRGWIDKRIISEPPQIDHGARTIAYFPLDYMERAKAELTEYRRRKQQDRKDSRESKLPLFLEKS